jgi:hypothetical protein
MIHLDLNLEERQILLEVLECYISDLTMEISGTDRLEFREMLKARRRTVIKVIESLKTVKSRNN